MIGFGTTMLPGVAGPGDISFGLELWLRADRDVVLNGTTVLTWADQSGNGRNAMQNVVASQPVYTDNSANNQPGFTYDNTNDFMTGKIFYPTTIRNNTLSVMIVSKMAATGTEGLWDDTTTGNLTNVGHMIFQNSGSRVLRLSGATDRTPYALSTTTAILTIGVWDQQIDGQSVTYSIYEGSTVKGTPVTAGTTADIAIVQYRVGALFQANPFNGDILEVAVWSIALNSTQRTAVANYCNLKYGTPL